MDPTVKYYCAVYSKQPVSRQHEEYSVSKSLGQLGNDIKLSFIDLKKCDESNIRPVDQRLNTVNQI